MQTHCQPLRLPLLWSCVYFTTVSRGLNIGFILMLGCLDGCTLVGLFKQEIQ